MRVRMSEDFRASYKLLKKRHKSLEADFERLLASLLEKPMQGVVPILDFPCGNKYSKRHLLFSFNTNYHELSINWLRIANYMKNYMGIIC